MAEDIKYYEAQLKIDKNDLDEELQRNPMIFLEVSQEFTRAVSRRDQAKDDLKVIEAKLQIRVRREAEEEGKKLTDKVAEAMVLKHKERRAAVAAYLSACEEADQWGNLKDAFKDRGFVLKELGSLYVAGYWGQNSVRGESSREVDDMMDQRRRARIHEDRVAKGRVRIKE